MCDTDQTVRHGITDDRHDTIHQLIILDKRAVHLRHVHIEIDKRITRIGTHRHCLVVGLIFLLATQETASQLLHMIHLHLKRLYLSYHRQHGKTQRHRQPTCFYQLLRLFLHDRIDRLLRRLIEFLAVTTTSQTQLIAAKRHNNIHTYLRQSEPVSRTSRLFTAMLTLILFVPRVADINTRLQLYAEMRRNGEMPSETLSYHHRIALVAVILHLLVHPTHRPRIACNVVMRIGCIEGEEATVEHMAEPISGSDAHRDVTPLRELRIFERERIKSDPCLNRPLVG